LSFFVPLSRVGLLLLGTARRDVAPAWRLTFFAGAKKVSKETPESITPRPAFANQDYWEHDPGRL
jgi:hypothetical protein